MAEHRRRHDHPGVIAALKRLQIGPASESRFNRDPHFTWLEGPALHLFHPNIFFAVKDCRFHGYGFGIQFVTEYSLPATEYWILNGRATVRGDQRMITEL